MEDNLTRQFLQNSLQWNPKQEAKEKHKAKKRKQSFEEVKKEHYSDEEDGNDALEQMFEQKRRKMMQEEKKERKNVVSSKLPIKIEDGAKVVSKNEKKLKEKLPITSKSVKQDVRKKKQSKLKHEEEVEEEPEEEIESAPQFSQEQIRQLTLNPYLLKKREEEIKTEVAEIATTVLADPEAKILRLNKLLDYCKDWSENVVKMALISSMALFKDIIPDYRINTDLLESQANNQKNLQSKSTQNLVFFEMQLVKLYQQFLQLLDQYTATKSSTKKGLVLQIKTDATYYIASFCACELLQFAPHFNFRANVMEMVVERFLTSKIEKVSQCAFEHVSAFFSNDPTHGEASEQLVQIICQHVKKVHYRVNARVIDCFLGLPLRSHLFDKKVAEDYSKSKRKKATKKAKDLSFEEELERNFELSKGEVSEKEKKEFQTTILRNVIVCYVRLLKENPSSPLMFCSLAGLAKFAHLMNVDLLYDLLVNIKTVFLELRLEEEQVEETEEEGEKKKPVPLRTILQSLITTSKLIGGIGQALNIDMKDVYDQLYTVLGKTLFENRYDEINMRLLIDALYLLLVKSPTRLPSLRIAAFCKRILCYCLASPVHTTIPLLEIVQQLFTHYMEVCDQMFSGEEVGVGQYNPEVNNPDTANAYATSLWECFVLHHHYHPHMKPILQQFYNTRNVNLVKGVMKEQKKELISSDYQQLFTLYNLYQGTFVPPLIEKAYDEEAQEKQKVSKQILKKPTKFVQDLETSMVEIEQQKKQMKWFQSI